MEKLTAHAITALHCLCHRIALTREEQRAVDSSGASLGPRIWAETVRLLETADAAGQVTSLDIGFTPFVLLWLGLNDETACVTRHGIGIADSLRRDIGGLSALAHFLEASADTRDAMSPETRAYVVDAWVERANRLSADRTAETADALMGALEQTLDLCPPSADATRSLRNELLRLCEEFGDPEHAARVRGPLERIVTEPGAAITLNPGATLALSVLWAMTHHRLLLASELHLDPEIDHLPDEWERIRTAVLDGSVADIPVPTETARAWCTGEGLSDAELRECLDQDATGLAVTLLAVEYVWGGGIADHLPEDALRQALAIARIRRVRIERGYRPPEGERPNIFYEAHQGVRRSETMERVALIHRLNEAFRRLEEVDPSACACAFLDQAAESESLGRHEQTREYLEEARRLLHGAEDSDQAEYGHVCLAQHAWASGEVNQALAMLAQLGSERARELGLRIESREEERRTLRDAEREHRRRADLESWCEVAYTHMAAEHTIAAERCARRICREHPAHPLAWETQAHVLHAGGRHRDAVEPARMAVSLSAGDPVREALLARILSRIRSEG